MTSNQANDGHSDDESPTEPYKSSIAADENVKRSEQSSSGQSRNVLWMLPAVIILGVVWFLVIVPGKIAPLTIVHFLSMQGGPVIGTLGITIWWLASRRLSWRSRIVGVVLGFAVLVGTMTAIHPSMRVVAIIWALPIALSVLVGVLLLGRNLTWPKRGWIAFASFTTVLVGTQIFRTTDVDAAFRFRLVARWTPTAEDQFLAKMKKESLPSATESKTIELPDDPSKSDWAEFRGPKRDGILRDVTFDSDWESNPPEELWRRSVGPGWSSLCVVGSTLFTQEQRGQLEAVTAYDLNTGTPIWVNEIEARFEASMGGIGPRGTPTYRSGQLFVTGGTGVVQCLDATTGDTIWQHDLVKQSKVRMPEWGFASSPLIVNDLVVIFAGGGADKESGEEKGVIALQRDDGQVAWMASDGWHGYSSAQLATIDGVEQILMISNVGIHALVPESGQEIWKHRWDIGSMARVTQPLVVENAIYIGTGYGNGTQRIDVSKQEDSWEVSEAWIANLKPYFNDCVYHQGHLYGFDNAIFMSVDAESGEKNWKGGRYGNGQVLLVQKMGLLLIVGEKGQLVLAEANPKRFKRVAEIKAIDGISWNHPVISDGKLLVRNSQEMVCYQLKGYRQVSAQEE